MADLKQGQDAPLHRASRETSPDLSAVSLATPNHLRDDSLNSIKHTAESVQRKWSQRQVGTGVSIECRRSGGEG
jgi:hypothetical protein